MFHQGPSVGVFDKAFSMYGYRVSILKRSLNTRTGAGQN